MLSFLPKELSWELGRGGLQEVIVVRVVRTVSDRPAGAGVGDGVRASDGRKGRGEHLLLGWWRPCGICGGA